MAGERQFRFLDSVYLGLAAHDVGGDTENGADATVEMRLRSVSRPGWKITVLPTIGASVSFSGETNTAYLGATARYRLTEAVFAEAFFGLTLHDADIPVQRNGARLGCRVLFREGVGLGYLHGRHAFTLYGSHISHGDILCDADENSGLTSLGIRYGYHF